LQKCDFLPDLRGAARAKLYQSALIVVGIVICFTGCSRLVTTSTAGDVDNLPENSRMVNLVWKPTMTGADLDLELLDLYSSVTVSFLSIIDERTDPRVIGKMFEDPKVRAATVPIFTRENVVRWWRHALLAACKMLTIKTEDKKGTLRLEIEITGFSMIDDYTQTGSASLRIHAFTSKEMLIWEGSISGSSDLYVHGTETDGISECLSNTLIVTLHTLFADQSFRDAVAKSIE
jgi:hypothetical protein